MSNRPMNLADIFEVYRRYPDNRQGKRAAERRLAKIGVATPRARQAYAWFTDPASR